MPKIRLAPEVTDKSGLKPENPTELGVEDYPDTSVWAQDGAAGAETTIVPPVTVAPPLLAWSVDEDDAVPFEHRSWASVWGTAGVLVALAAAVAVVIGLLGWIAFHQDSPTPVSVPSTMPAAALPPISTPVPTATVTVAAQAPTPAFSGRYAVTETAPDGRSVTNAWEITPCGDECAKVSPVGRRDVGPDAHLIDSQWVFDNTLTAFCADGSSVPSAGHGHFTIDAITLRGTLKSAWTKEACGQPPGDTTHSLVLTKMNP
jgi:hypothetical protein